jgi:hypothetical protein
VQLSETRLDNNNRETPAQILDRNFTHVKSLAKSVKLGQVLQTTPTVGQTFCFNLTNATSQVLLSSCNQLQS